MDSGSGNRRVPRRNRQLMQIADHISGGVNAVNRCLLLIVHLESTGLATICSQGRRKFRADCASQGGIQNVQMHRRAPLQHDGRSISPTLDADRFAGELYSGALQ